MSNLTLTRRQVIAGTTAATGLCFFPAWKPIRLLYPKGAPVPAWLEASTKPSFFGVAVEVIEEYISPRERAAFVRMGYRDVPETRLTVRATDDLEIGDCLVRYKAGSRVLYADKQAFQGREWWSRLSQPADTWMWTEDGPDMLLYARVAEPDFCIINERLAKRVALRRYAAGHRHHE